jgi:CheY-like chemotaxis protein
MDSGYFQSEKVDLARLVRHVIADRRDRFKKVAIFVQAPDTPVWISVARLSLEHIVQSIIDDATYCTSRTGSIEIVVAVDNAAAHLRLQVGRRGMEPSSSVESLVNLHGGTVDSSTDALLISFPLRGESSAVVSNSASEGVVGERRRVLIIEDNRDASETLQRILEFAGHAVKVAHTGSEGIRIADEWRPDYVFCDIGLPELDGYHVADELRRNPTTRAAHLIAITGYGTPEDRERCRCHGFEQHFTKPADPEALLSLLSRHS